MDKIVKKEVCRCVNCGNEAEMVFTCTLPEAEAAPGVQATAMTPGTATAKTHVKAKGTCSHCGNEADMWIDV
ncbi:MAG: hypothetical protein MUD16_05725 [Desulfobacterales bacterium]|jgi:hypothetical protein|nr:hypothetical protein [Desulfobacterales bacterium]